MTQEVLPRGAKIVQNAPQGSSWGVLGDLWSTWGILSAVGSDMGGPTGAKKSQEPVSVDRIYVLVVSIAGLTD